MRRRRNTTWRKQSTTIGFPIVSNGEIIAFVVKRPRETELLQAAKYALKQIEGLARGNVVEATIKLNKAITEYYK